jgi:hypothetical protein
MTWTVTMRTGETGAEEGREMGETGYYAHVDSADVDDQHPEGTVSIFGPEGTDETIIGRVAGQTVLADAEQLIAQAGWVTAGEWDGIDTGMIVDVARRRDA